MNVSPSTGVPVVQREIAWIAAGIAALPFLQALPTDQDRIAPLLILLPALWACRRRTSLLSPVPLRVTSMEIGLALIVAVTGAVAVAASRHSAASLVLVAGWILLVRFSLEAAFLAKRSPSAGGTWLDALVAGSAIAAVSALVSYASSGGAAMFPYPHHRLIGYSTVVGVCAASHLLCFCPSGKKLRFSLLFLGATAIWTAGLWSGSRAPLAALAGAFFIWFLRAAPATRLRLTLLTALPFGLGLILALLIPSQGNYLGLWNAVERTATATGSISELSSSRSDFWRESWEHFLTSPLFGLGPDAYRYLTPSMDGLQPHNFMLQWLLDFGIAGAVPLLVLAGFVLWRGWSATAGDSIRPWAAIFTASLLSGSLDGNLYHFLGLFPAMLAAGFCLSAAGPAVGRRAAPPSLAIFARAATTIAVILCLGFTILHATIFFGPTPASWNAPLARTLRAFPATTYGVSREVSRWVTEWMPRQPADALAASRWAQENTSIPVMFHLQAAQILQRAGDGAGTLRELQAARQKAHRLDRPDIEKMIEGVSGGSSRAPSPAPSGK